MNTARLFLLWNSEMTNTELAAALGVGRSTLGAIRRRHKLPARAKDTANSQRPRTPDPSEKEIAEMTAHFRSRWTDEEWEERHVGPKSREWTAPAYQFDRTSFSFQE